MKTRPGKSTTAEETRGKGRGNTGRPPTGVTDPDPVLDGEALDQVLAGLSGADAYMARREVDRLRLLATQPRPRPETERDRLLQAIADADCDYQRAQAAGSHQAADRGRRHKLELEQELAKLDVAKPAALVVLSCPAGASRVKRLEVRLAQLDADGVYLRQTEQWTQVPALERAAIEISEELDKARAEEAGALDLDRDPAAVARAVLERHAWLRDLASRGES